MSWSWGWFQSGTSATSAPGGPPESNQTSLKQAKIIFKKAEEEQLQRAVFENDSQTIESLLEEGVNPNINDSEGLPILLKFASNGNKEMIDLYSAKGGNLTIVDNDKWNALHFSCGRGHFETTKYLVSIGIDHNAKDKDGKTPFDLAKERNQIEIIEFLERVEKNPLKYSGTLKPTTPEDLVEFKNACKEGKLETVKTLFKKVTKRTQQDGLRNSVSENKSPIIKFLLEEGMNPNINDLDGRPLLLKLSEKGNKPMIELYKEKGGNLHVVDHEKYNALHISVGLGHVRTTMYLVSVGVDFNGKEFSGKTPLDLAIHLQREEIVEFLKEVVDNPTKDWSSILTETEQQFKIISYEGNLEKVKKSFKKVSHKVQQEALEVAVLNNNTSIISFFLEQGVNANFSDKYGRPLLLCLASYGNKEMIELYLEKGGKLNVTNETKWNALHYSAYRDHLETSKFLVYVGIEYNAKNSDGKTPLDLAKADKIVKVVQFLQEVEKDPSKFRKESKPTTPTNNAAPPLHENSFWFNQVWGGSPQQPRNDTSKQTQQNPNPQQTQPQPQPHPQPQAQQAPQASPKINRLVLTEKEQELTKKLTDVTKEREELKTKLLNAEKELTQMKRFFEDTSIELETLKAEHKNQSFEFEKTKKELLEKTNEFETTKTRLTNEVKEKESQLLKSNMALSSIGDELHLTTQQKRDLENAKKHISEKEATLTRTNSELLKSLNQTSNQRNELQTKLTNSEMNLNSILEDRDQLFSRLSMAEQSLTTLSKEREEFSGKLKVIEEENEKKRKSESENQELADFLNYAKLSQFFSKFQSEGIEMETLEHFNDQEFEKLGLNMGQRKKLMVSILNYKKGNSSLKSSLSSLNISGSDDFVGHFGISKSEIKEGKHLGSGASGDVFQGIWKSLNVAIKKLKMTKMSESNARAFKNEANLMFHLRHPHVVQLMGFVDEEPYMLIMEFVEKGNLSDYLKSNQSLDWNVKKQISLEIAQGMLYLHDLQILHRDLKSLNVLLTKHLEVKLSDFGLASLKKELNEQSHSSSGSPKGTIAWMAPELLESEKNTKESDVYAFGVVCFEMCVHRMPWQGFSSIKIIQFVSQGKREEIPKQTPQEYASLIMSCWDQNSKNRKSFEEIVPHIQSMNVGDNYKSIKGLEDLE